MIFGNMYLVVGILVLFLALTLLLLVMQKRRAASAGAPDMQEDAIPVSPPAATGLEEVAPAIGVPQTVGEADEGDTERVNHLLDSPGDAPINHPGSAAETAGSESLLAGEPALFWDNEPESRGGSGPKGPKPIAPAPALDFSGSGPAAAAAGAASASPVDDADPALGSPVQPTRYTADSAVPTWDDPTGPIDPVAPLDGVTLDPLESDPAPQNGNGGQPAPPTAAMTEVGESSGNGASTPADKGPSNASATSGLFATAFVPAPMGDPIARLVDGLLEEHGDLTQEELRRLELYRPERVLAYTDQVVESVSGRGKESKRSRLARIRRYVESVQSEAELETRPADQPLRQSVGMPSSPEMNEHIVPPSTPTPAGLAAATTVAGIAATTPEYDQPVVDAPGIGTTGTADSVAPAILGMGKADADWQTKPDAPLDPELSLFPDEAEPVDAEPDAARPHVAEAPVEEPFMAFAPEAPIEVVPTNEPQPIDELHSMPIVADDPPVSDTVKEQDEALVVDATPTLDAELDPNDSFAGAPSAADPFESAQPQAETVLALPPEEREQALCDLDADELARTFTSADDPRLKRAAVDKLEEHGTGEALSALQECLEDPDPELQLYALEAAERLLSRA